MPSSDLTYRHPVLEADTSVQAASRASLVIEASDGSLRAVALSEGIPVACGRAEPSDVVINDKSLSRVHARFTLRGAVVEVEDLGSTNGMEIGGSKVQQAALEDGDAVRLGGVHVTVTGLARELRHESRLRSWRSFSRALDEELLRARTFAREAALLAVRSLGGRDDFAPVLAALRPVDVATRFSQDLLLILLPETSASLAAQVGEKLRGRLIGPNAAGLAVYPVDALDAERLVEESHYAVRRAKPGTLCRAERETAPATNSPVIESDAMKRLYALVDRVARATLSVLILGETGVGKEVVAQQVHARSTRSQGPFIAVNCASIPSSLLESVLFGHERGAFTGASERRLGLFEQASGGTLFLDEVGELSAEAQASLLRVLELKKISRVGSTKEIDVDVRVIAATHRDLPNMVAQKAFREDLMFRLDALSLRVPPLRERREEIAPLARRFLERARAQWGVVPTVIDPEAMQLLVRYRFPGNVRQLKNIVERAAVIGTGPSIGLDDLPDTLLSDEGEPDRVLTSPWSRKSAQASAEFASVESDPGAGLPDRVRAFEARLIREALARSGGNHTKAAALLAIPRRTLTNKVHVLGLSAV